MAIKELNPVREELRRSVASAVDRVHKAPPEMWWFVGLRALRQFEKQWRNSAEEHPELSEDILFWSAKLQALLLSDEVRDKSALSGKTSEENTENIAHIAETALLMLSAEMAERFYPEVEPIVTYSISLEEAVKKCPERLRLIRNTTHNGIPADILEIKELEKQVWHKIPFPIPDEADESQLFAHKGGSCRAVLGVLYNSPTSMQRAELPFSDLDGVIPVSAPDSWKKKILQIGVDHDGIEMIEPGRDGNLLPFENYALGRDTNSNRVMITRDAIVFSQDAMRSAQTGEIAILGHYAPGKAIYGVDRMFMEGFDLSKQRGLARLIKFMVEGKALRFEYLPISQGLDMGIYVLFLARRFASKQLRKQKPEIFAEHMEKMFVLLKQMGQVREGETSIIDVCERAHRDYPFFDFDSDIDSEKDLFLWKLRKFGKQVDREESWKFKMESGFSLPRFEGDDIPIWVTLDGFEMDESETQRIVGWWDGFVESCKQRTKEFPRDDMYEMLFMHSDSYESEEIIES